jgi:DNA gyrase subunit B
LAGEELVQLLHKLMAFRKLLQVVERRGPSRDVVMALLDHGAHDLVFFEDRTGLDAVARELTLPLRAVTVKPDEEHNAFMLSVEDRTGGYPRRHSVGVAFAASAEYRALMASYDHVRRLKGPMVVSTVATPTDEAETADTDDKQLGGAPLDRATKLAADPRKADKDRDVPIGSLDELIEFFIAAGRRGVAVNRYKGLGEMNPDQLWATTMRPEGRTLLQVRAEDHAEADLMFTTLMGDQVEPRRKFIEDHALDVKNLDV